MGSQLVDSTTLQVLRQVILDLQSHYTDLAVDGHLTNEASSLGVCIAEAKTLTAKLLRPPPAEPPKKKMKRSNHHIKGQLPPVTTERGMRASLTVLSDEFHLGDLTYCSWTRLRNGCYCYNVTGRCPLHKREHDGGAWRWQIQQKPNCDYCYLMCWRDRSSRKFPELPLF